MPARNLLAVLEPDAHRAIAREEHLLDGGPGPDLDARFACGRGDGRRDGAGAAARQSPGSEFAVDLAHVVVQQHVGRAG